MIRKVSSIIVMIVVLVTLVSSVFAAEYSAVVTAGDGKGTLQEIGKLYVNGNKVRCETKTPKGDMIKIRSNKTMWIINPAVKQYIEVPALGESLDFYITAKDAKTPKGVKSLGVSNYNGYVCDKYSLTSKQDKIGKITTTVWVARKLGAVIKMEAITPKGNSNIDFKILIGKQKKSLFEVPKGYKKIKPRQR